MSRAESDARKATRAGEATSKALQQAVQLAVAAGAPEAGSPPFLHQSPTFSQFSFSPA